MRRLLSLCLCSAFLVSVGLCASAYADPPSVWVQVDRGRDTDPDGTVKYHERVWLWAWHDPVGEIASCTITDSEGGVQVVTPDSTWPDGSWSIQGDCCVLVEWSDWGTPIPPPPGPYTVGATNTIGESDSLTTPPAPVVAEVTAQLLTPDPNNSTIYETVPTFSWVDGFPEAGNNFHIWDETTETEVWNYSTHDTSVVYNFNGTASQAELIPGRTYFWQIDEWRCEDCGISDPLVSIQTAAHAFGRFSVYSPIPTIHRVGIHRGRNLIPDGTVSYHETVWVDVADLDGVGDIASVSVTDTEGAVHVITPTSGDDTGWYAQSPTALWADWTDYGTATPPPAGIYSVAVVDFAGHSDTVTANPLGPVPEISVELIAPAPNYSVISETQPTFSWACAAEDAEYQIAVYAGEYGDGELIWEASTGGATTVPYDFDGSAVDPELVPGQSYQWIVMAMFDFNQGQTDPRLWTHAYHHSDGRFTVYAPPSIEHVWVDRGPAPCAGRPGVYGVRVGVEATGDIASITVVDPDLGSRTVTPEKARWWWREGPVLHAGWEYLELHTPPTPAPFMVTVTDSLGTEDSLTTPPAPPVSDLGLATLLPSTDDVITEIVPTFAWSPAPPGATTSIGLREEGSDEWTIWWQDVTGLSEVVYNDDGSATYPELLENHSYAWYLESLRVDDDGTTDPRVTFSTSHKVAARFTVYGEWSAIPPDLPGKLTYEAAFGVMLYGTDPSVHQWVGEEWSWWSDWSPDGSELLVSAGASILEVESFDGSGPHIIQGTLGMYPRWAPDGERIAYVKGHPWDVWSDPTPPLEDICVAKKDGSEPEVILHVPGGDLRHLDWSPDGLWIAYNSCCDPSGYNIWLTRYDGTESQPVVPTAVTGYPGYDIAWMAGTPSWSPDGKRLGVRFSATASGGSQQIDGIGTISRDGGAVTPVFLDPPGFVCCASSWFAGWSPDGESVLFFSAHHLPPDPDWASGKFEHGAELFVTAADGAGEPVRLTYDYSRGWQADWWAPNTEPGADVSVSKGDTTVTFETVAATGSTTVCVTDEPPGETPEGLQFLGDYYDISTDAEISGVITIEIHYDDADVPGGQEEWLSLLHWENDAWVDITVRPIDTVNNIITGECTSLSEFGMAFGPQFVGLLPPVNNDGTSIFKLKRTVPVKFQLVAPDGSFVTDAVAKLYVAKVSDQVVGSYTEPESTSAADSGNTFRYDADADQYIFNLGTKGLSTGTWVLQVMVNGMVAKEVWVSLK